VFLIFCTMALFWRFIPYVSVLSTLVKYKNKQGNKKS
jgi:hypothetical protein